MLHGQVLVEIVTVARYGQCGLFGFGLMFEPTVLYN